MEPGAGLVMIKSMDSAAPRNLLLINNDPSHVEVIALG